VSAWATVRGDFAHVDGVARLPTLQKQKRAGEARFAVRRML